MTKRKRVVAAASAGGAFALALTGCGVQATVVHTVATPPITVNTSSPAASAPSPAGTFPIQIFLTSRNQLVPVTRYVSQKPTDTEILAEFTKPLTKEELDLGYATAVPVELTLQASGRYAHEYIGNSDKQLTSIGQLQIVCSLDVYWWLHPDGRNPSTQLIVNGRTVPFDDCLSYAPAVANEPGSALYSSKLGAPAPSASLVKPP